MRKRDGKSNMHTKKIGEEKKKWKEKEKEKKKKRKEFSTV